MTITAAKTFYAQFTANSYTLTWDLGDGNTETTKQTYGEALVFPTEPTRKNAEFLGWFTEADGGTQVDGQRHVSRKPHGDSTYYAHWEITEVFSVTVPVTLPLVVDEGGEVHVGAAEIINAFYRRGRRVQRFDFYQERLAACTRTTTDMAHDKG